MGLVLVFIILFIPHHVPPVLPSPDLPAPQTFFIHDSPADGPPQTYALIPTGVRSVLELRAAIANDQALQAHFADFDLQRAVLRVLDHDERAYVSYRKNGQILWTKNPVLLHKGELILDDGTRLVRARCGNRIAYLPQFPTESLEPGGMLDPPVASPPPASEIPVATEIPPPTKVYAPPPPPPPCCNFPIVPIIYVPPGGGSPPSPPAPPWRVPEPATIATFGTAGLAGLLLLKRRRQ